MTKKNIAFTVGFITAAVFLGIYVFFRKDFIEKNYIAKITKSSASIENLIGNYLAGSAKTPIQPYQIRSLLSSIIKAYPDTALAAISGGDDKIKEVNRTAYVNDQVFSDFQSDYSSGVIAPPNNQTPVSKVYSYEQGGKQATLCIYVFVKNIGQYKFVIAYPFVLDIRLLVRVGIEIFLIIILAVIISSFVYILLNKKRSDPDNDFYQERRQSPSQDLYENTGNACSDNVAPGAPPPTGSNGNEISAIIADIAGKSGASSVFLYGRNSNNVMASIYGEDNIGIARGGKVLDESIVKELSQASAFLTNKSATLILPLKNNGKLAAAIELKKDRPFNRAEIKQLKALSQRLIEKIPVQEIPDGIDSYEEAFKELVEKYRSSGNDFSIVFISCFNEMGELSHTQKELAMQFILPEIKKYTGRSDKIFEYKEYIALLMENAGSSIAKLTTQRIDEILSKLRFKVDERYSRLVKPVFTVVSTDNGIPPEKLTAHALREINQK